MITLNQIIKKCNSIVYNFSYSEKLNNYFSGKNFVIEYPESVESVPNAILAIPFVCNVLPIVWLEDIELIIPELDEDFYNSIPNFKKGYVDMYPDADFKGSVTVDKIVNCRKDNRCGSASFFSGGVDATTTLLRHLDEKPDLISIWGSDITFDNVEGWKPIQNAIDDTAEEYDVKHINIHSSFRQFDKEWELDKVHRERLNDGWWHGVKHGIGLISHAAPYAWLHNLSTIYIASTYSPSDGKITSASYPTIDNNVRFCGASIVHDGFEMCRQDKIRYVIQYHKNHPDRKIHFHVCWESSDGGNCCNCEKCYRTMVALWIEREDPCLFGFEYSEDIFSCIYKKMALNYNYPPHISAEWKHIQDGFIYNEKDLKRTDYFKQLKWLKGFDFLNPEENLCRKWYRIKTFKDIRCVLSNFKFYQKLHELKMKTE